jgi:magnesium transporter
VIAHKQNDILRLLTIFTVILLPPTLIAGIYGMNVPLPFQHSHHAFWIIEGGTLLLAVAMLSFFRRQRWL